MPIHLPSDTASFLLKKEDLVDQPSVPTNKLDIRETLPIKSTLSARERNRLRRQAKGANSGCSIQYMFLSHTVMRCFSGSLVCLRGTVRQFMTISFFARPKFALQFNRFFSWYFVAAAKRKGCHQQSEDEGKPVSRGKKRTRQDLEVRSTSIAGVKKNPSVRNTSVEPGGRDGGPSVPGRGDNWWCFGFLAEELLQNLFDPCWEIRFRPFAKLCFYLSIAGQ